MNRTQLITGLVALLLVIALAVFLTQGPAADPENGNNDMQTENDIGENGADDQVLLRFLVLDETEEVPADNLVIIVDEETWTPDLEGGQDETSIGPWDVGEEVELLVYPDGLDDDGEGREIPFNLTIHEDVISESEEDTVQITITDTTVILQATTADPQEQEAPRFEEENDAA